MRTLAAPPQAHICGRCVHAPGPGAVVTPSAHPGGGRGPPGRSPSVLQADVAPGPVPLRSADCECLDARKRGTSEAATWGPPRTRTTWRTCRGQAWRQCGRAQGPGLCPETCMRRPARHAPRRVPGASAGPDTRRAGGPCVPAATRFLTCPLTWTLAAPRRGEAPGHALPASPLREAGGAFHFLGLA